MAERVKTSAAHCGHCGYELAGLSEDTIFFFALFLAVGACIFQALFLPAINNINLLSILFKYLDTFFFEYKALI